MSFGRGELKCICFFRAQKKKAKKRKKKGGHKAKKAAKKTMPDKRKGYGG